MYVHRYRLPAFQAPIPRPVMKYACYITQPHLGSSYAGSSPSGPASTSAGILRPFLLFFLAFDPRFLSSDDAFLCFDSVLFDCVEPLCLEAECPPLECSFSDPIILPRSSVDRVPEYLKRKVGVVLPAARVCDVGSRC